MRIFLDLDTRLILSTPNRSIRTLEFKRRDNDLLELQFVRGGAVVAVSSGTTVQYGLKPVDQYGAGFFSVGSFVKSGSGEAALFTASVNLNTVPIAQAFDLEPKSIAAMLEIEASDGNTLTSSVTLPVTLHNDVIRGDEATPAAIPDLKATQPDAISGTSNEKWMTPLTTFQSIAAWIAANLSWSSLTGKPSTFTPSAHTHLTSDVTGLDSALAGKATAAQGAKADSALQSGTAISNISGLQTALDGKQPAGSYAPASGIAPAAISGTAVVDADPRLTDSRQPTAHQSTHAAGGADALTPQDIGAVKAFQIEGNPPQTNIAPAAMELRDNEDSGVAALKCDGSLNPVDNPWSVSFPDKFRAAIGAAKVTTGGYDPDPSQGVVDQAIQLWDSANDAPALKISDGAVSFGPYAENTNVAANFREAIGAASVTDPTLTGTLTVNGPEDENNAISVAVSGEDWIKIGPSDATVSSTADLYMGSSGKIGIGTEDPTERLTIAGNLDMLGGAVKNLRAPVDDNDAVRLSDLDSRIPTPPDSGTFSLQCVDGVISWVAA